MSSSHSEQLATLLAGARDGRLDDLGQLLEMYRSYMMLVAQAQLGADLRVRASHSDVVQETFLEAHRDFSQFQGSTPAELVAWIRRILLNNIARVVEQHKLTAKRDVRREISLRERVASLEQSSFDLDAALVSPWSSPGSQVEREEQAVLVADQLAKLPEDYRQVVMLRNLQGLSFEEVAARLGRSSGAVRMLWLRAIDRLRQQLEKENLI